MSANVREVLRLYRTILRRGKALRYTDRDYFRGTVSEEFKRWKGETDPAEIQFQVEKAKYFLSSDLGGLQ